jgi:uncharacterized membrane protein
LHTALLVVAAFLASTVEMVEALTIVLAVGVTRGWRSVMYGVAAATLALTVVVAALGPAIGQLPIDSLRLFVGGVLLIFGLQWLRKAILRASGFKDLHDEAAIYQREVEELRRAGTTTTAGGAGFATKAGVDWYGFTIAFKGVFLEGLEVAFIVVTFGGTQHHVGLAAIGALAALVVVATVGAFVHAPLSRVPENLLKFVVGVMLTAFGIFWGAEGAGATWPGKDLSVLGVIAFVLAAALGMVALLRRVAPRPAPTPGRLTGVTAV